MLEEEVMPSTLIQNCRYDRGTRTLSVWFVTNGKRYDYQNVPPETYDALRSAFSKGRFFNRQIRGNYEFRQVEDVDTLLDPGRMD
jgi:hypothetical protein